MAKPILKSCGVYTARFLECVLPFYNFMHERVKRLNFAKMVSLFLKKYSLDWQKYVYDESSSFRLGL